MSAVMGVSSAAGYVIDAVTDPPHRPVMTTGVDAIAPFASAVGTGNVATPWTLSTSTSKAVPAAPGLSPTPERNRQKVGVVIGQSPTVQARNAACGAPPWAA